VATEASETFAQPPAAQELVIILLDEPGQPLSVAQTGRLRTEGLEVIADHLEQDALCRRPRAVDREGLVHAVRAAYRMPPSGTWNA